MTQDVTRIDLSRMDRLFVGTHTGTSNLNEAWTDSGHYYEGVQFLLNRITEENDELELSSGCGWKVTGSGQPAQNSYEDLQYYENVMNGKRNVAICVGRLLFLFRLVRVSSSLVRDNRISIVTDIVYDNHRIQGATTFQRWITNYEVHVLDKEKNVSLDHGHLVYKAIKKLSFTSQPQSTVADSGSNNS